MSTIMRILKKSRTSFPLVLLLFVTVSFLSITEKMSTERTSTRKTVTQVMASKGGPQLQKSYRLLDAEIELLSLPPEKPTDEVRLKARITVVRSQPGPIYFSWKGDGVRWLSGEITGSITLNGEQAQQEFEVTASQITSQTEIHFVAYYIIDQKKYGDAAVFSFQTNQATEPAESEFNPYDLHL